MRCQVMSLWSYNMTVGTQRNQSVRDRGFKVKQLYKEEYSLHPSRRSDANVGRSRIT